MCYGVQRSFHQYVGYIEASVLLVEETGVQGENHRPTANSWYTLSHNVVSSTSSLNGIRTHKVSSFRY